MGKWLGSHEIDGWMKIIFIICAIMKVTAKSRKYIHLQICTHTYMHIYTDSHTDTYTKGDPRTNIVRWYLWWFGELAHTRTVASILFRSKGTVPAQERWLESLDKINAHTHCARLCAVCTSVCVHVCMCACVSVTHTVSSRQTYTCTCYGTLARMYSRYILYADRQLNR